MTSLAVKNSEIIYLGLIKLYFLSRLR